MQAADARADPRVWCDIAYEARNAACRAMSIWDSGGRLACRTNSMALYADRLADVAGLSSSSIEQLLQRERAELSATEM